MVNRLVAIMETDGVAIDRYTFDLANKKRPAKPARSINAWVEEAAKHANISQAELGRLLAKRLRQPSYADRSVVNKMTKGRDVSADEMFAISEITGYAAPNADPQATTMVPLAAWVSAGAVAALTVEDDPAMIAAAGLGPGDWVALRVEGDSMDRISPPKSIIFVNRADKQLVPNGCYVIEDRETGEATYKRYRPGPDRFEPVSANKDLAPLFPDNEPKIIGRVRRTMLDL